MIKTGCIADGVSLMILFTDRIHDPEMQSICKGADIGVRSDEPDIVDETL